MIPGVVSSHARKGSPGFYTGNTTTFGYTGGDQTFSKPSGIRYVRIKAWGAGGGARHYSGGYGGFSEAEIMLPNTNAENLTVVVGQAGDASATDATTYGGGGGYRWDGGAGGGRGGGRSSVRRSSEDIVTAGGGGGGGFASGGVGGQGGGLTGAGGTGAAAGSGGTQTGGGAGGSGSGGTAQSGGQYFGGYTTSGWAGGGGGGGWYGGGGGSGVNNNHGGGGGGSGFVGRSGSSALGGTEVGSTSSYGDTTPRLDTVNGLYYYNTKCLRSNNSSDPNWGSNAGINNNNGRIVIIY